MRDTVLASYKNGGTRVTLYEDGTKVREILDPDVPHEIPEQLDLKITDWCDAGCAWCHEGSTRRGKQGDLNKAFEILSALPAGAEVAIGGGDPVSHPGLEDFLVSMYEKGIVCALTVNGRHIERSMDKLTKWTKNKWLRGIGVSFDGTELTKWKHPHLVHHLIAGVDSPRALDGLEGLSILVLGYKHHGRGRNFVQKRAERVLENEKAWFRELPVLAKKHRLSFDTLAVERLKPERLFLNKSDMQKRFMGYEGQYSMYVDAVSGTYGISSFSDRLGKWGRLADMFQHVREKSGHHKKS
jgi:hypothetical protein